MKKTIIGMQNAEIIENFSGLNAEIELPQGVKMKFNIGPSQMAYTASAYKAKAETDVIASKEVLSTLLNTIKEVFEYLPTAKSIVDSVEKETESEFDPVQ
jgi:hypothetical protein